MAATDVLKNLRDKNYGEMNQAPQEEEKSSPTSRMLKLSDEETKELAPYAKEGGEIVLEVTGRLENDHFHVSSVHYAQGGSPKESGSMGPPAESNPVYVSGSRAMPSPS